jgi:hypothetical protein
MRWIKIIGLFALTLVLVPGFSAALADDVLTVSTVKGSYELGNEVSVKGYTPINETVTIIIQNSTGAILTLWGDPNNKLNYTVEFTLDDRFKAGEYEVNASVEDLWARATFEVVIEPDDEESEEGDEDPPCEEMTEEELYAAIDRALWFIDKVNSTANSIGDEYDMTDFYELVGELRTGLLELNESIGTLPIEEARELFCDLRKDVSNLNGLLNSVTKEVKVRKVERFMEQMEWLINSTVEKIERFNETDEDERLRAALEAHQRKLWRLRLTLNATNADDLITDADGVVEELNGDLDGFDSNGFSLKEMFKAQAKIQVLNATVERMKAKGKDMGRLQEKLRNAEALMGTLDDIEWEKNWGKMKDTLEGVEENLGGVGKALRELNKPDKQGKSNKGGNGKGKGSNGH